MTMGRWAALLATMLSSGCVRTIVVSPRPEPDQPPPARAPEPPRERERPRPATAATLGIPAGHLPQAGECRIWVPGVPPGRQRGARSRSCVGIAREAPAGSWVVYRPTRDRQLVHVRVVDQRRPGMIVVVRVFEFDSGRFLREEPPDAESRDERDEPSTPKDRPGPVRQPKPDTATPPPSPAPPQERPGPFGERRKPEPAPTPMAPLDIPPGHLPQPGECRIWIPGTPPGRQPHRASGDCDRITRGAPAASWVVYRPTADRTVVHVRIVDARRAGVVVTARVFDAQSGRFVREEQP